MSAIEEKLEVVKKRIAAAKARSPYRQDVTLVAVTKFHPLEDMEEVLRLGVKRWEKTVCRNWKTNGAV